MNTATRLQKLERAATPYRDERTSPLRPEMTADEAEAVFDILAAAVGDEAELERIVLRDAVRTGADTSTPA